jgi:hypothetical protein
MQHTDDFGHLVRGELVEDQMATYREYTIARTNMVAGLARLGVVSQSMECLVKFGEVAVSLFAAPSLFGEFRNTFLVGSGRSLDSETRHQ